MPASEEIATSMTVAVEPSTATKSGRRSPCSVEQDASSATPPVEAPLLQKSAKWLSYSVVAHTDFTMHPGTTLNNMAQRLTSFATGTA